jgi:hypothetical protein
MNKNQMIEIIYELQAEYSTRAGELFKKIGQSVLIGDADTVNDDAIKAMQNQAKVDVLEELLEKLEQED